MRHILMFCKSSHTCPVWNIWTATGQRNNELRSECKWKLDLKHLDPRCLLVDLNFHADRAVNNLKEVKYYSDESNRNGQALIRWAFDGISSSSKWPRSYQKPKTRAMHSEYPTTYCSPCEERETVAQREERKKEKEEKPYKCKFAF